MSEPLEAFFERALVFLEETVRPFAERYPANAKHLLPEVGRSADPHLDRLIEGLAMLAGRIGHKLDSEFSELTDSLLQILYPHLGLIIPSMAIAQVKAPPGSDLRQGWTLEKGARIRSSAFGPNAESFQYTTGYPVTIWPIELKSASWEATPFDPYIVPPRGAVSMLRLRFACTDGFTWDDLPLDRLRLHLVGERQFTSELYESLFVRSLEVTFGPVETDGFSPLVRLNASECLSQVGFNLDEGLLPFPGESFVGYRLLMELLSFPQKFLFADLAGWQHLRGRGLGSQAEVIFFFNQTQPNLERALSARNFMLGCTPIVNVFEQSAEPIDYHHRQSEYRVVPSRRQPRSMEVYRLQSASTIDTDTGVIREILPFYASQFGSREKSQPYYHASRRLSVLEEVPGTETFVTVIDPEFHPSRPSNSVLDIRAWCTNRDHPFKHQQAGDRLTQASGGRASLELLHKPTSPLRPPLRHAGYWRLLGQNSLNHASLIDGSTGIRAIQEALSLCDFSGPTTQQLAAVNQQIITGIKSIRSRPIMAAVRTPGDHLGMCRGMEILIEFDEEKYMGTGVLLVASVLERFLALYAGINSFTKVIAKTSQAEGYLKIWKPRAGADCLP